MLPPFIIEQIRQREEKERRKRDERQPRLELPLERSRAPREPGDEERQEEDDDDRGVVVLDVL